MQKFMLPLLLTVSMTIKAPVEHMLKATIYYFIFSPSKQSTNVLIISFIL